MKRTVQRVITITAAAALTAAAWTGITAGTAHADQTSDHHWTQDDDDLVDLDIFDDDWDDRDNDWDDWDDGWDDNDLIDIL